jgi:DNA-binding NarL/FixJ family response regulator
MASQPQILIWAGDAQRARRIEEALGELLESGSVICHHRQAPEDVIAAVLDNRSDLMIADLGEVGPCGVTTLQSCRRVCPRLRLITIAATFNEHFRSGVLSLGVHFYLATDFVEEELQESVRSALGLSPRGAAP